MTDIERKRKQIINQKLQKLPSYDHHMQSTKYQALDHDEPQAESAYIPKQAPGHITTSNIYVNIMREISVPKHEKRASGPKCPVTGKRIQGIPHLRPAEYKRSRLSRNRRTVNRAYGGVLSGGAVRERIIRAFLVEEQKIVKKVLKIQKAKEKLSSKS
ncbi:unnamed protein product [Fraxinus pennsylvanica]|uniref:60S ribosomal protein L34 n=1 Tax=Fraxinus pennsylvanica TaxID=56036 RepID=A0AAD2ADH3_9LAMI|nr:unnamed protein product [Fraxinus pennsylvanica]